MLQQNYRQRMSWEKSSAPWPSAHKTPHSIYRPTTRSGLLRLLLETLFKLAEHAEQGMIIYAPQQHRSHAFIYAGHDPGMCCRILWCPWPCGYLAYPDQALDRIKNAVNCLGSRISPIPLVWLSALGSCGSQLHQCGDGRQQAAQERAQRQVIALSSEHDFALWFAMGKYPVGLGADRPRVRRSRGLPICAKACLHYSVRGGRNPMEAVLSYPRCRSIRPHGKDR